MLEENCLSVPAGLRAKLQSCPGARIVECFHDVIQDHRQRAGFARKAAISSEAQRKVQLTHRAR